VSGTFSALRELAGDAAFALREKFRGVPLSTRWDGIDRVGRLESDGPDAVAPIPGDDVRAALDEMSDADLYGIAATVIKGWTPILLKTHHTATDVDILIDALRDRSAQFAAIDAHAESPRLDTHDLHTAIRMFENRPTRK
jgi:hypothetical protein